MAASFGVQLKKSDTKGPLHTPGGALRSDFKTKPVSDLKAMFNKKDEEAKCSEIVAKKPASASDGPTGLTSKTVKTETGKSKYSTNTTTAAKFTEPTGLSQADKNAFAALKNKLNMTDLDKLDGSEPVVAVAKTYGSNAHKATFETKGRSKAEEESNIPATKTEAASILSFGLTKLRTRPGYVKSEDRENESIIKDVKSPRSRSPASVKKDKYIPGVARGWKGSGDDEADSKTGKFAESSVGKVRTNIKTERDVKVKGFRSVSPVTIRQNSSDESSGSANLSPRGYKPNLEFNSKLESDNIKTDINKNIKKFETSTSETSVFKSKINNQNRGKSDIKKFTSKTADTAITKNANTADIKGSQDQKSKLSAVEQLAKDKEKMKAKRNSGSFSSDSEKGKRSPKTKGEFKWMDKSRISLEEFKEQRKIKNESHRPLSRASSSSSSSSLSRSDASDFKARLDRFSSPDSKDSAQSKSEKTSANLQVTTDLRRRDFAGSRKINPDKFKDIKKGFESGKIETRTPSPQDRKPLKIKTEKKLLERKQSFEGSGVVLRKKSYDKQEIISPRDRGNVLKTVQALTELDAKAKAKPKITRRTGSIASESFDDDSSTYEDTGQFYDEIQGMKIHDDISNEGDLSSEADLIYEEIPAYTNEEKGE